MEKRFFANAAILAALIFGLVLAVPMSALAGATAQQTVNFSVPQITEISVSGDPGATALDLDTPVAGSDFASKTDTSTTWAISCNTGDDSKKLTAAVNSDLPANTGLTIDATAPTGAISAGAQSLSATAVDVVTGIDSVVESGLQIDYQFSATHLASEIDDSRTVTLTLTDS